jgi:hypothetical protein
MQIFPAQTIKLETPRLTSSEMAVSPIARFIIWMEPASNAKLITRRMRLAYLATWCRFQLIVPTQHKLSDSLLLIVLVYELILIADFT